MDDERLRRHDLTDEEWDWLAPLLPADPPRGGRWLDHRMVINGVFHRTRAGCAWRDLPPWYGNWKTVYNRHRRWSLDGTWEKILDGLRAGCDEAEGKTGRWAWIPPWCVPTSTRLVPGTLRRGIFQSGGWCRSRFEHGGSGPVTRRALDEDSPGCRSSMPPDRPHDHSWPAWR